MQGYQGLGAPARTESAGRVAAVLERPGARLLARRIPGATYCVVPDAGHMINMEQPAPVNELLTKFVLETSEG